MNLYTFDWLFGFVVSVFLYTSLSWIFPAKETLMTETIWNNEAIHGVQASGSDVEHGKVLHRPGSQEKQPYQESDAKPW